MVNTTCIIKNKQVLLQTKAPGRPKTKDANMSLKSFPELQNALDEVGCLEKLLSSPGNTTEAAVYYPFYFQSVTFTRSEHKSWEVKSNRWPKTRRWPNMPLNLERSLR